MTTIIASPVIILGKQSHLKAQLQVKPTTSPNISLANPPLFYVIQCKYPGFGKDSLGTSPNSFALVASEITIQLLLFPQWSNQKPCNLERLETTGKQTTMMSQRSNIL